MSRVFAFIQARMGSSRLCGKIMMPLEGKPVLWHVIKRVEQSKTLGSTCILTSNSASDDETEKWCRAENFQVFRGDEHNVLERYFKAAEHYGAETIVRLTADCPLIDSEVIDRVVRAHQTGGADYTSNTLAYSYPQGLDIEVFSFDALKRAFAEAKTPAEKEHVTRYIRRSGHFKLRNVAAEEDLSSKEYRWTVDEPQDYEFIKEVYRRLWKGPASKPFGWRDVLTLLEAHPEIVSINSGLLRHEAYYESLLSEKDVGQRFTVDLSRDPTRVLLGGEPESRSSGSTDVDHLRSILISAVSGESQVFFFESVKKALEALKISGFSEGDYLDDRASFGRLDRGSSAKLLGRRSPVTLVGDSLAEGCSFAALVASREVLDDKRQNMIASLESPIDLKLASRVLAVLEELERRSATLYFWENGIRLRDGIRYFSKYYSLANELIVEGSAPLLKIKWARNSTREHFGALMHQYGIEINEAPALMARMSQADVDSVLLAMRFSFAKLKEAAA